MSYSKIYMPLFLVLMLQLTACSAEFSSIKYQKELGIKLADTMATKETVNLFYNLKKISTKKIIFGHQNSTAYGVGWSDEPGRSDVKDVTDSYPGLYGWDFADITPPRKKKDEKLKDFVLSAYQRGGINTFCWHYSNPVSGGSFYDTTVAVRHILPGASHNKDYVMALDSIAEYAKTLVDADGNLIPVIFRPFHEFDGSWFWWGKRFCSREEFIQLWQFTVSYLRDQKGVKNFLYAFSPDRMFYSETEFLDRYPGDEYVDVVGMDNYYDFTPNGDGLDWVTKKLQIVSKVARDRNKIAAFTETGLESIPDSTWWTNTLLPVVNKDSVNIAYLMVWRNANKKHHYAPYKGAVSEKDFVKFKNDPKIIFEDKLPKVYIFPLTDDNM